MDEKLKKEQKESLLDIFTSALADDIFTLDDSIKLVDLIREACEREKALTEEAILLERLKLK